MTSVVFSEFLFLLAHLWALFVIDQTSVTSGQLWEGQDREALFLQHLEEVCVERLG